MIFDELSNAFSRFSLRRLEAELDGGGGRLDALPPADHGSFGAPARRGLSVVPCLTFLNRGLHSKFDTSGH